MLGRRASRLAPPRRIARGGSPPRCAALHPAHAESFACRGLPAGAPRPRHDARQGCAPGAILGRRISRLAPPLPTRIAPAHYPCGAMGTSRPTAITPAIYAPRAHRPYPVAVRRCGGARCPHRAAAHRARAHRPPPVGAPDPDRHVALTTAIPPAFANRR